MGFPHFSLRALEGPRETVKFGAKLREFVSFDDFTDPGHCALGLDVHVYVDDPPAIPAVDARESLALADLDDVHKWNFHPAGSTNNEGFEVTDVLSLIQRKLDPDFDPIGSTELTLGEGTEEREPNLAPLSPAARRKRRPIFQDLVFHLRSVLSAHLLAVFILQVWIHRQRCC